MTGRKTGSVLDLALTAYQPLPSIRHATSSWLKGYRWPQHSHLTSVEARSSIIPASSSEPSEMSIHSMVSRIQEPAICPSMGGRVVTTEQQARRNG